MSESFSVGDIVSYNRVYLDMYRAKYPERRGVIVRLRGKTQPEADIRWDGRTSIDQRISLSFLKKVGETNGITAGRQGVG